LNRVQALLITSHPPARGTGRGPFYAAIGIAVVDIVLFVASGKALA
jgi:hypothetical protein